MNNIIVIETGSNAQLLQDNMDFVTNRGDYHCTKLLPVIKCEKNLVRFAEGGWRIWLYTITIVM